MTVGAVNVWEVPGYRIEMSPFGGIKESGLGREKGRYGVESYLEWKTMYLSWETPA